MCVTYRSPQQYLKTIHTFCLAPQQNSNTTYITYCASQHYSNTTFITYCASQQNSNNVGHLLCILTEFKQCKSLTVHLSRIQTQHVPWCPHFNSKLWVMYCGHQNIFTFIKDRYMQHFIQNKNKQLLFITTWLSRVRWK